MVAAAATVAASSSALSAAAILLREKRNTLLAKLATCRTISILFHPQELSVWTAAAILATAATAPVIGSGAAMLFEYGNKRFEVLKHAKGISDDFNEQEQVNRSCCHWSCDFLKVFFLSIGFVVSRVSLWIGLRDMMRKFFLDDVSSNFCVLWFGEKRHQDNTPRTIQCSWPSLLERCMRVVSLIWDIFGVFYFIGHLLSVLVEVIVTLIGASTVCMIFAWTYTTYVPSSCTCLAGKCRCPGIKLNRGTGNGLVIVPWEQLLTCGGCRDECTRNHKCSKNRMLSLTTPGLHRRRTS